MLEQLQPPGNELLFTRTTLGGTPMQAHRAATNKHTNDDLDTFVEWVGSYAGPSSPDRIPKARRPGGSIADAIQYRHHSIQTAPALTRCREARR